MIERLAMDNMTTGQFLKLYFERATTGFIELFYLIPDGLDRPRGMRRSYASYAPLPLNRDIPDVIPQVEELNRLGYGVYFGTTPTARQIEPVERVSKEGRTYMTQPRRHESDVEYLTSFWCDIDDVSFEDAYERLFAPGMVSPTLIVKSGGGVHAYWTLTKPYILTDDSRIYAKKLLHAIALCFGGDVKCRDMARIMRLPGTVNTKPGRNNAPCEVMINYIDPIPFLTVERIFSPYMPRELPTPTRTIRLSEAQTSDLPPVTRKYLSNPPDKGGRNQYLYAAARGCLDAGKSQSEATALLTPTARQTGLSDAEIEITLASAYRASRGMASSTHTLRMGIADRRLNNGVSK